MKKSKPQPTHNPTTKSIRPENAPASKSEEAQDSALTNAETVPSPKSTNERAQCRPDQTPWWKHAVEVGAVIVGIVVAIIYFYQLRAMIEANRINGEAFVQTQRPWVGIKSDPRFTKAPIFYPRTAARPPTTPPNTAIIENFITYDLENYGNSPARKIEGGFFPNIVLNQSASQMKGQLNLACERAETYIRDPNSIPEHPPTGILLPKGTVNISSLSYSWIPSEINEIREFWITGCFVYQDTLRGAIHHTRYLMKAKPATDAKPVTVLDNPKIIMYLPIGVTEIWDSDAD